MRWSQWKIYVRYSRMRWTPVSQRFATASNWLSHDDVIKWKHFPCYWPFVRGIHRSPVNPPHKGQWRGALMFSSICAWINGWVNNSNLRSHHAHYDVIVMSNTEPCGDPKVAPPNSACGHMQCDILTWIQQHIWISWWPKWGNPQRTPATLLWWRWSEAEWRPKEGRTKSHLTSWTGHASNQHGFWEVKTNTFFSLVWVFSS